MQVTIEKFITASGTLCRQVSGLWLIPGTNYIKIHSGLCWLILQLFVKTTNQGVSHICACLLLSEMASPDLSVPSPQPRT